MIIFASNMEQQQRSLIFTAAVGLIILAIIVGSIYYLVKFIQNRVASNNSQAPQASVSSIASDFIVPNSSNQPAASAPTNTQNTPNTQNPQSSNKKSYDAGPFQLTYSNTWGILTCNNSQNFELDPTNAAESSIACDSATKPVTVLVSNVQGCEGETTKIGNIDVVKSQRNEGSYVKYQWCTKTNPVLNITHRVSPNGERATSKQDFSKQIEEIISNLSFSHGS